MGFRSEIKRYCRNTERSDRRDLIAHWDEEELYKGKIKDVFSLIFRTRGCYRSYSSGCSMCGYYTDTNPDITVEDIQSQLKEALSHYEGEEIVKIYTSGSFLDRDEIDEETSFDILESFDAEKIVIETRPEFVERDRIRRFSQTVNELELAIGLESSNDFVLENCINKGFLFKDYKKSVEEISDLISVRTYLLLKPPFLTEKEAIEDLTDSIQMISDLTDIISINPVNVQKGTLLEELWHKDLYSPPWLWSIIEAISSLDKIDKPIFVSRAGLGSDRGSSNCEECNARVLELIESFNKNQEVSTLNKTPECDCRSRWKIEKEIEPYLHFRGSPEILSNRYAGYV
ncbi:MAG: archaeosine biosynthesis radical SAM protein RaSEA [Candidatus Thermoplasmatota archaeon]|nr:archaeosine biosynthesis radical SAM protein RaSEA [Candidatus Thermoplasmatota archaeon]MBS3789542.1 archaeosine biosynthesis radical SAM protein RaSEA [Candidatus Thermoplasmatota archaeon]